MRPVVEGRAEVAAGSSSISEERGSDRVTESVKKRRTGEVVGGGRDGQRARDDARRPETRSSSRCDGGSSSVPGGREG